MLRAVGCELAQDLLFAVPAVEPHDADRPTLSAWGGPVTQRPVAVRRA